MKGKTIMKTAFCLFTLISLILLSASVNSATWKDDFNDGKDDGWQVFTGTWKVENGVYRMPKEAFGPPYPITYAMDGKKVGEFTIEAKVRNDAYHSTHNQSHAGFAFGRDDKGNGWALYFRHHAGKLVLKQATNNGNTYSGDIDGTDNVIPAGDKEEWHVLKAEVSAEAGTLTVWVNGKEELKTKQEFDVGKVGLWAVDIGAASFDDVVITGENVPAMAVETQNHLTTTWAAIKSY